jgi:hypothetical protein
LSVALFPLTARQVTGPPSKICWNSLRLTRPVGFWPFGPLVARGHRERMEWGTASMQAV